MGIQTFSPQIFRSLGRGHSLEDSYRALQTIKQGPISNISLDLLYGLPFQTEESWRNTLQFITENYKFPHLSAYILEVDPHNMKSQFSRNIEKYKPNLPKDEILQRMYLYTHEHLEQKGYEHYEVSSYALSQKSVHNQVYWEGEEPYWGFGLGAASFVNNTRITRPISFTKYKKYVDQFQVNQLEQLEGKKELRESVVINQLRRKEGLDLTKLDKLGISHEKRQSIVKGLQGNFEEFKDFFSCLNSNKIALSPPKGFLLGDEITLFILDQLEK